MHRSKWPLVRSPRVVACLLVVLLCQQIACADDDDEIYKQPGLLAEYYSPADASRPAIVRYEPLASFVLGADETIDTRLPARGWRVRYQGVLDVQQSAQYQFSANAQGTVRIVVGEREAYRSANSDGQSQLGPQLELSVGYHPLTIEYEPAVGPARLALFWQSSAFPREPLSSHAIGHLPDRSTSADTYLAGRLAVEEHSCLACHRPNQQVPLSLKLDRRPGPHLAQSSGRLNASWVYHWLADPQAYRPEAVMPKLFDDSRSGEVERYALAHWLTQSANDQSASPTNEVPDDTLGERGRSLYERSGCVVCHEKQELGDGHLVPARATLTQLASKTSLAALAEFIHDPYAVDPSGRMPNLGLSSEHCAAIAAYLWQRDASPAETPLQSPSQDELIVAFARLVEDAPRRETFAKLPPSGQTEQLAREVIAARRCANCHEIQTGSREKIDPSQTPLDFAHIVSHRTGGCLASEDAHTSTAPRFGSSLPRDAVAKFLGDARQSPNAASPVEQARLTFARFNCTSCHEQYGSGGLSETLTTLLTENQSADEAELIRPPSLTGVAAKLRETALSGVLLRGERARPWMALKMPRFKEEHMQPLVPRLAAIEGHIEPSESAITTPDPDLSEAGRTLVGSQGFGCIKCHDIRGIPSGGTRGPDLARVTERVHHAWYRRWMHDPQRLEPGTRMPTVFFGGQSPYKSILDGEPSRQIAAIWHYLSAGNELELPEGLEAASGGQQTIASAQPLVMRTFLPNVSPRSMAIQFPSQVHAAFDAQTCRLAYAWRGGFLDLGPVWTGRGGRPAEITGELLWTAPAGFPWIATEVGQQAPPDFAAQSQDVHLGAQPPDDGTVYPSHLRFRGYRLTPAGPVMRYEVQSESRTLSFDQALKSIAAAEGPRWKQSFSIDAPPGLMLWFRAAQSDQPLKLVKDGHTAVVASGEGHAADHSAIVTHQAGRTLVWRVLDCAASRPAWFAIEEGDKWSLIVAINSGDGPTHCTLECTAPSDDRPEAITAWSRDSQPESTQ